MKAADFQKTKSARVIQVIETVSLAGDGTDAHPIYEIHQYWSLDGKLLAKSEPPINPDDVVPAYLDPSQKSLDTVRCGRAEQCTNL